MRCWSVWSYHLCLDAGGFARTWPTRTSGTKRARLPDQQGVRTLLELLRPGDKAPFLPAHFDPKRRNRHEDFENVAQDVLAGKLILADAGHQMFNWGYTQYKSTHSCGPTEEPVDPDLLERLFAAPRSCEWTALRLLQEAPYLLNVLEVNGLALVVPAKYLADYRAWFEEAEETRGPMPRLMAYQEDMRDLLAGDLDPELVRLSVITHLEQFEAAFGAVPDCCRVLCWTSAKHCPIADLLPLPALLRLGAESSERLRVRLPRSVALEGLRQTAIAAFLSVSDADSLTRLEQSLVGGTPLQMACSPRESARHSIILQILRGTSVSKSAELLHGSGNTLRSCMSKLTRLGDQQDSGA
ncbi:hypothetical protein WJX72_005794 [[Myrmecia] bisecta]|uniref:Uncharacterized protein n=1 Tax=[Myrmecia] bisecta TaxID=41462 RepID=A0AAW1Q770_9CHLO